MVRFLLAQVFVANIFKVISIKMTSCPFGRAVLKSIAIVLGLRRERASLVKCGVFVRAMGCIIYDEHDNLTHCDYIKMTCGDIVLNK